MRSSQNLRRRVLTLSGWQSSLAAISLSAIPSAAYKMILAR